MSDAELAVRNMPAGFWWAAAAVLLFILTAKPTGRR